METGNEATAEWSLGMRLLQSGAWECGYCRVEPGNEATVEWSLGMRLLQSGAWE